MYDFELICGLLTFHSGYFPERSLAISALFCLLVFLYSVLTDRNTDYKPFTATIMAEWQSEER